MHRILALLLVVLGCACAQQTGPSRQESVVRSFQARVTAIDLETRVVTLENESGRLTFRADEGVQNLEQVKVGDVLRGDLVETLLTEARPATDAEKSNPVTVTAGVARAEPGQKPAGLYVRELKAVFTVASIDEAAGGGELRDAGGELHFVKARDPAVLRQLEVGDTVVVTYTEALRLQVVAPGF
jgi:hypothetical protein